MWSATCQARKRLRLSTGFLFLCLASSLSLPTCRAKSKNHTAHNQTRKNHRNGIKKPKSQRYMSLRGVDPKFLRNARYAQKGTKVALAKLRNSTKKA